VDEKTAGDAACRALDYCVTDSVRWSERLQLLKRLIALIHGTFRWTISIPPMRRSADHGAGPGKTKFGIFFGDNTGYYQACIQLAEMLDCAGQSDKAVLYRQRAQEFSNGSLTCPGMAGFSLTILMKILR